MYFFFPSCRHSSTAVSSSYSAPLSRRLKMSSPSCSGRAGVSSWAGSPNPTATWLRRWAPPLTTQSRAPTRPSARSTSSSTFKAQTGWRWSGEGRCGQLHPPGSSTASQPSASCLCLTLKQQAKTHFLYTFKHLSFHILCISTIIMCYFSCRRIMCCVVLMMVCCMVLSRGLYNWDCERKYG